MDFVEFVEQDDQEPFYVLKVEEDMLINETMYHLRCLRSLRRLYTDGFLIIHHAH